MSNTSLNDILEDKEPDEVREPEQPVAAENEAEQPVEQPEEADPESTGEERQAEESEGAGSAPPADKEKRDDPMVPRSALEDERRKRQELERERAAEQGRLTALEREIQALKGNGKVPEKAADEATPETDIEPDMFDDPQAWRAWNERQIMAKVEGFTEKQFINFKINQSVELARTRHTDFDEVMEEWPALRDNNPALYEQALREAQPGEFAYTAVKRHRAMQEIGDDPAAWRERESERIRTELAQQPQTSTQPQTSQPQRLPPSLATTRNTGTRKGPEWQGSTSLDDILAPDQRG